MTKYFCDICGKEIDLKNPREIFSFSVYESLYDICNCGEIIGKTPKTLQSKGYVICDDCEIKIADFIETLTNSAEFSQEFYNSNEVKR